jgi:hypothetical protein
MPRKPTAALTAADSGTNDDVFDLQSLLHPARAFERPVHVVNDPDLTLNEKRAILASWASDACAVEAVPALRQAPGGGPPVGFDEVMEALRELDKQAKQQSPGDARSRRMTRKQRIDSRRNAASGGDGQPIN